MVPVDPNLFLLKYWGKAESERGAQKQKLSCDSLNTMVNIEFDIALCIGITIHW